MTLEIWRRYEPIAKHDGQFEVEPRDVLVWRRFDDGRLYVAPESVWPKDYVPGLLRCYINGARCLLSEFDAELAKLGMTREGIVGELRA